MSVRTIAGLAVGVVLTACQVPRSQEGGGAARARDAGAARESAADGQAADVPAPDAAAPPGPGEDAGPIAGTPEIALVRKARTGSLPKAVALSPDGSRLFVTNFGRIDEWNVFVYDADTLERIDTVDFEGNGVEMAFTPDGSRLLVSNFRRHLLMEIDPSTSEVTRTWTVGKNPKTIAVSADGTTAWVSNWTSDDVTAVDLVGGEVLGSVHTGNQPRGIASSPDGRWVWVSNCAGHSVTRVDAREMEAVVTLPLGRAPTKPRHVVVSPDGAHVYVTAQSDGLVWVLDPVTLEVTGRIRTGPGPKTIDITADGLWAFTANWSGDSITAINLSTLESATFPEDEVRAPCGLAVSPDGGRLWVTGWDAGLVGEYAVTYPAKHDGEQSGID